MLDADLAAHTPPVWSVGALCRAIADALQLRFNPLAVKGELAGFSRAASGHCYFSLKDSAGQLRCAMFKRVAGALDYFPQDGELVEVCGRLAVYEPRGDLQLIVESMRRAGQGDLFAQFLQLKAKLAAQGCFDAARKRALPLLPRAIGLVTSTGAAALHDVLTVLQRRAPHIPVLLVPAAVQGIGAPAELISALEKLYLLTQPAHAAALNYPPVEVILLVRGGGAMQDLWAFNDEQLAHAVLQSPVPVISGVGHETDFTIADFVADLRAATPSAAAELVVQARAVCLSALSALEQRAQMALLRHFERHSQRLDQAASRLGRPSSRVSQQELRLRAAAQALQTGMRYKLEWQRQQLQRLAELLPNALARGLQAHRQRLERAGLRLGLLDPRLALERGYVWLSDAHGRTVARCQQTFAGQALRATLADGTVDLTVVERHR